jgi:hypothetical protein
MAVSELLAVKIELTVFKLRQLQTAAEQITAEQRALVEQARAEVGAPIDHVYDTDARAFQPPAPTAPVPRSTTAVRQATRAKSLREG